MDKRATEWSPTPATGMMKIARLSEAAGVSKSTIHNYVRSGLLPPPQRVGLNLHLYSQRHLELLQEIRRLREEGKLPIGEIMDVLAATQATSADPKASGNGTLEGGPLEKAEMRTEENSEKRQQIIEKAIELFNRFGYEKVRISDITNSASIGKGTFYLYFDSKEDLLSECLTSLGGLITLRADISDKIRATKDFLDRTQARFVGFQEQYDRFSGILNLMRSASFSSDPEISKRAREAYVAIVGPLRKDLQTAVQERRAREVDEELAAYALLGAADYLCYRAMLDSRYTPQEIAEFVRSWVKNALSLCSPLTREPTTPPLPSAKLTDPEGTCTAIEEVRFDGKLHFQGALGRAVIELELTRIASIAIVEPGATCKADVTMKDGTRAGLHIRGDIVVSGETALGTIRIPIRDCSELAFASSPLSGEQATLAPKAFQTPPRQEQSGEPGPAQCQP